MFLTLFHRKSGLVSPQERPCFTARAARERKCLVYATEITTVSSATKEKGEEQISISGPGKASYSIGRRSPSSPEERESAPWWNRCTKENSGDSLPASSSAARALAADFQYLRAR